MSSVYNKTILSISDQGINSVSNFLASIIVAKTLSPDHYGLFALFFNGIFLVSGLQNALITAPLKILGMRNDGTHAYALYKTHIYIQLLFGLLLIAALTFFFFIFNIETLDRTFFAFCLSLFFYQLKELGRAIYFVQLDIVRVLTMDCIINFISLIMLSIWIFAYNLSPTKALLILALGSGVGSLQYILNKDIYSSKMESICTVMAANWQYGKWLMLETLTFSLSSQIYLYFIACWIDRPTAGAFNAVQTILHAVNVFMVGVISFILPLARRRLLDSGYEIWRQLLINVGIFLVVFTSIIMGLIALFGEELLRILYNQYFSQFAYLIYILAIGSILSAINTVFSTAYQTANLPKIGFFAKLSSAIITLLLSYPLISNFGIAGAAIGITITQVVWLMVYIIYLISGTLNKDYVMHHNPHNIRHIKKVS